MNKNILFVTVLGLFSTNAFANEAAWIFTSSIPSKNEMISIARKEFCRPLNTSLMSPNCAQYKNGYVCPQEDQSQFVITTYPSKNECNKALKKARRILAQK